MRGITQGQCTASHAPRKPAEAASCCSRLTGSGAAGLTWTVPASSLLPQGNLSNMSSAAAGKVCSQGCRAHQVLNKDDLPLGSRTDSQLAQHSIARPCKHMPWLHEHAMSSVRTGHSLLEQRLAPTLLFAHRSSELLDEPGPGPLTLASLASIMRLRSVMVLCRGVKGVDGTDSCPLWSLARGMVCIPGPSQSMDELPVRGLVHDQHLHLELSQADCMAELVLAPEHTRTGCEHGVCDMLHGTCPTTNAGYHCLLLARSWPASGQHESDLRAQ